MLKVMSTVEKKSSRTRGSRSGVVTVLNTMVRRDLVDECHLNQDLKEMRELACGDMCS